MPPAKDIAIAPER